MKYCTKCGKQVINTDKFCADCGQPTDQTSNNKDIKADLKVELTNATTEKTLKAVSSSISSGTKAVKKGTKASATFLSRLIFGVLILGVISSPFLYSNYQKKEAEEHQRYLKRSAESLICAVKRKDFRESSKTEKEMCVFTQFRAYSNYEDPWGITRQECGLTYIELNKYKDWYIKGNSCTYR